MTVRHLQVIVCGAGPAADVAVLIEEAHRRSWTVAVTATPSGRDFIDPAAIEELTGNPVRSSYRTTGPARRVPAPVDGVVIAPATYNTVNKLALGIADNYALTSAAELIGRGVPTVVVPFVNGALASRAPFRRAVAALRDDGVRVLSGPADGWEPHPPGTGEDRRASFPWRASVRAAAELMAAA